MRFLIVMIVWCFSSLAFMISSIVLGLFHNWFVLVYLGVYLLLIVWGIIDAIKEDKRLITDERGVKY